MEPTAGRGGGVKQIFWTKKANTKNRLFLKKIFLRSLIGDEYAQLNLSVETKPHCLVPGEPLPIIAPGYHLTYPFRRQILPPILKNITRIFQKTIPLKKDVSYFHNFSQHSFLLQSNFFSSRNWNHLKKILKYEKSICNS